jgi:hypothetical protein
LFGQPHPVISQPGVMPRWTTGCVTYSTQHEVRITGEDMTTPGQALLVAFVLVAIPNLLPPHYQMSSSRIARKSLAERDIVEGSAAAGSSRKLLLPNPIANHPIVPWEGEDDWSTNGLLPSRWLLWPVPMPSNVPRTTTNEKISSWAKTQHAQLQECKRRKEAAAAEPGGREMLLSLPVRSVR